MDPTWAAAAFGAGLGAAAVAVHLAGRRAPAPAGPRLTSTWRLAELDRPTVACRDLEAPAPPGARVLASGRVAPEALRSCAVRRVAPPPAEFAVDAAGSRALLFPGGVRPGAWALPVSDPALVRRLRAEAAALEAASVPYAERRSVADLAGEPGLPVEAEGVLREAALRGGAVLARLEDGGHAAAVRLAGPPDGLLGRRVAVRGRLARDASGYLLLEADEVRMLARPGEPGDGATPPS